MSKFNLQGLKEIFSDEAFEPYGEYKITESYKRSDIPFLELPIPKNEDEYYNYFERYKEEFIDHNPKYAAITEQTEENNPLFKGVDWDTVTYEDFKEIAKKNNISVKELINEGMDNVLNSTYFKATTRLNTVTLYSGMGGEDSD